MRRETCDYIDQQTNLIIEHCEKCKENYWRDPEKSIEDPTTCKRNQTTNIYFDNNFK